jgi:uncharacterized protein YjbI with pentapeptide repeats
VCHQSLFPLNQIHHSEKRWHTRLLCKNEACNFHYQFDLTMTPRVFEIFEMDFQYALDAPQAMEQSGGYHSVSLFVMYMIQLLGRTSLKYLGEQLDFQNTNLEHYLIRLSEDDLIGFDGKYSQISERGEKLLQTALTQKQEDYEKHRHKDPHGLVAKLTDLLMQEDIASFNAERSRMEHVALDLSSIDLSGRSFKHANLRKIRFSEATFDHCLFEHCNFNSAVMERASFKKSQWIDCQIQRVHMTAADLSSAIFEKSFLVECDLTGANAFHTSFKQCNLRSSNLSGANLRAANCKQSDLTRCILKDADMTGANLWEAILNEADLEGCEMNKVQISLETKFLDAKNLMAARNISKQLWEKLQVQNKSLPDFNEYRRGQTKPHRS